MLVGGKVEDVLYCVVGECYLFDGGLDYGVEGD